MRRSYKHFTQLILALLFATWATITLTKHFRSGESHESSLLLKAYDAETVFALGLRLPLGCSDLGSIELIPNLSHRVADRLMASRHAVVTDAMTSPPKDALKKVFGIGEATARHLLEYLSLSNNCAPSEPLREAWPVHQTPAHQQRPHRHKMKNEMAMFP